MTRDIDTLFPDGLSDEAAFVLCEFVATLSLTLEHRYFGQLRRYHEASRPPRDPEQPWKTPTK